jgi:hypothetical protein
MDNIFTSVRCDMICESLQKLIASSEKNGIEATHLWVPKFAVEEVKRQFPGMIVLAICK